MTNISKRTFKNLIVKKLQNIKRIHVLNIIDILFDELRKDIYEKNKVVKIKNFCEFGLRENKPKLHFSIVHQKVMMSKPKLQLRFNLYYPVKKILYNYIDPNSF